ncbi:lariat debranching enzyme, C-terminal domain-containing protein [Mariannaea sp. PMI_226]|nr:lariat debranching enzyme, C-terminal domain-containing protein [Mariannaea sp. PMI_226]
MTTNIFESQGVRIAVEGCVSFSLGHGALKAIYASVEESCKHRGWDGVDLLIIGGDFQSCRNAADLSVMSCPVKYRHLGDFPQYYSGEQKAPYLTIFIAGNHEASSHLWELYYGGWVAPNIYYLGAANVVRLGPLRIAGLSGIWKGFDYRKSHHERLPFSSDDVKSFYHVREFDVRKLLLIQTQVDVGLSHDWPRAIEKHGDQEWLFRKKPAFRGESRDGTLGNVAAEYVMDRLRPPYWFSAHMHVKFAAVKTYSEERATISEPLRTEGIPEPPVAKESNPDEIDLDMDGDESGEEMKPETPLKENKNSVEANKLEQPTEDASEVSEALRAQLPASFARPQPKRTPGQPVPPAITNKEVRFLALDKCLPGRHFLQLCEIQPTRPEASAEHPPSESSPRYRLQYDPEWLAITRVFHESLIVGDRTATSPPDLGEEQYLPLIEKEKSWVEDNVVKPGKLDVPDNFEITAPPYVAGTPEIVNEQPDEYTNNQTATFCELLGIRNLWHASEEERVERKAMGPPPSERGGRGGGRGFGRGRGGGHRGGRGQGRGGGRGRGGHRGRW